MANDKSGGGDQRNLLPKYDKKVVKRGYQKIEKATFRHAHRFIIKRWDKVREVQHHVVFWIIIVAAIITATGVQLMWFQQSYKTTDFARNGTYAEAVIGPVDTLNPIFADSSAEQSVGYLLFSSLFRYDITGHLKGDLATGITVSKDGLKYTVPIRKDAVWHDGEALTVNDIIYTVDLIQNDDVRSTISGWSDIKVTAINDFTIQFELAHPYVAFDHALTFPILPAHAFKDVQPVNVRENDFSNKPIGSGPFELQLTQVSDSSTSQVIYLVRNDEYYGDRTNLKRFQLHVYNDRQEILKALSNNEVNAATGLSASDMSGIDEQKYQIASKSIMSGVYALFNVKSSMMQDKYIRSALQLATDKDAILEKMPKASKILDYPFIDGQVDLGDVKVDEYNPEKAEKVLTDKGWKKNSDGILEKDGQELTLVMVTTKDDEYERVAEMLVGQWRAIGINIDAKIVDPDDKTQNVTQTILKPRNYDILLYRLNIGADPDVFAYWHSSQLLGSGLNLSNYSNVISDDALSTARTIQSKTLRAAKYVTFAKQWVEDIPAVGLYQSTMQYVYSKQVRAIDDESIFVTSIDRYSNISDWAAGQRTVYKTP